MYGSLSKSLTDELKKSADAYKCAWLFFKEDTAENGRIIDATNFVLNDGSIDITSECFAGTFYGQDKLENVSVCSSAEFALTSLRDKSCFMWMFYDCTSLKTFIIQSHMRMTRHSSRLMMGLDLERHHHAVSYMTYDILNIVLATKR